MSDENVVLLIPRKTAIELAIGLNKLINLQNLGLSGTRRHPLQDVYDELCGMVADRPTEVDDKSDGA